MEYNSSQVDEISIDTEKKLEISNAHDSNNTAVIKDNSKEIRLAVIGNVDSGKSTLVGVLTRCILDDGRGMARSFVFNYEHEKQNGRTSSISQELIGFKGDKQIEPYKASGHKNTNWSKIMQESDRVLTLVDLCGHEKYLKTTIFGLTGLVPDYAMIIIGANMGIQRMTKEHLGIALALKIPIFIVITKIDIAPDEVHSQTIDFLFKVLRSSAAQKLPVLIREDDDVKVYADNLMSNRVCPIFRVSNVTGEGITKLRRFISSIQPRSNSTVLKYPTDKVEFFIDGRYNVKGIGLVVTGTLVSGRVFTGQTLLLGPDKKGEFQKVVVKSIHFKRTSVTEVTCGNSCSINIKSTTIALKVSDIRKGMVLLDKDSNPKSAYEFEAEVVILHHATTIKPKYQAVVHSGVIRQSARVISMSEDLLRTGDKGKVRFQFISSPEYLQEGASVLFREGRTRGLGEVTKVFYLKP